MKCKKCGAENAAGMTECGGCGHPLSAESPPDSTERGVMDVIRCQKCGHENQGYLTFCGMCGSDLEKSDNLEKPDTKKCKWCGKQIPIAGGDLCWECTSDTYGSSAYASEGSGSPDMLRAGGILLIIAGALAIAQGILLITIYSVIDVLGGSFAPFVCYGELAVVFGIIAVGGGVCAIRQERFVLAIIGSVCAILGLGFSIGLVLGIISLVFIAVEKDDFLD